MLHEDLNNLATTLAKQSNPISALQRQVIIINLIDYAERAKALETGSIPLTPEDQNKPCLQVVA